jgi:heat shock protein HslJ
MAKSIKKSTWLYKIWLLFSFGLVVPLTSAQSYEQVSTQLKNETFEPNKLTQSRWLLRSLNRRPLLSGVIITLQFNDPDYLHGAYGYNKRYSFGYALQANNEITVKDGSCSQIGCPENQNQELDYTSALLSVTNYKIEGTILSLTNEAKGILLQYQLLPKTKTSPENLIGKTWQLVSATGLEKSDLNAYTLRFDTNQLELKGTTICRTYKGNYHIIDEALAIMSANRKVGLFDYFFCSEKNTLAEESYIELLKNVWRHEVSGTQLELYADHDKKLVFKLANN